VQNCLELYDVHLCIESLAKRILEEICVLFFACKSLYDSYSRKTHLKLVVYLRYGLLVFINTVVDRCLCPAENKEHDRQRSKGCESKSPIETEHCNNAKCNLTRRFDCSKNARTQKPGNLWKIGNIRCEACNYIAGAKFAKKSNVFSYYFAEISLSDYVVEDHIERAAHARENACNESSHPDCRKIERNAPNLNHRGIFAHLCIYCVLE